MIYSRRRTSSKSSPYRNRSRTRGGFSSGRRRFSQGKSKQRGERIDFSRFINKAVITEKVDLFVPEHRFSDFPIEEQLKKAILAKGYDLPTPIQDKAIPHILKGSDVVGIADTGSGKTAAFLIPLIHKVKKNPSQEVLIVAPTRELAQQIESELKGFTRGMKLFSVCCVGGTSIGRQISQLRYKNSFLIGTPGRLKDLIERGHISLHKVQTIVLDEADRMLDMGFIDDTRAIIARMPKERHTLFFSATLSKQIERLISEFLYNPIRISVKTRETSQNVEQDIVKVPSQGLKLDILHDLLLGKEFTKVLVFGRTKHGVEKLSRSLRERGFKAESIHGDKSQSQRQRALDSFKKGKVHILIATDVAARGLDISSITHVINYDLPATYEDYIHRIGRTGRGTKHGKALTFIE